MIYMSVYITAQYQNGDYQEMGAALLTLLQLLLIRGWQRNEGLLLLHSFLSLDILVAFSIT